MGTPNQSSCRWTRSRCLRGRDGDRAALIVASSGEPRPDLVWWVSDQWFVGSSSLPHGCRAALGGHYGAVARAAARSGAVRLRGVSRAWRAGFRHRASVKEACGPRIGGGPRRCCRRGSRLRLHVVWRGHRVGRVARQGPHSRTVRRRDPRPFVRRGYRRWAHGNPSVQVVHVVTEGNNVINVARLRVLPWRWLMLECPSIDQGVVRLLMTECGGRGVHVNIVLSLNQPPEKPMIPILSSLSILLSDSSSFLLRSLAHLSKQLLYNH